MTRKKKKKTFLTVFIILIILLGLGSLFYFGVFQQSVYGSDNFVLYGEDTDDLTDKILAYDGCGFVDCIKQSKYFSLISDTNPKSGEILGNDFEALFLSGGYNINGYSWFRFNSDIRNRNVRINIGREEVKSACGDQGIKIEDNSGNFLQFTAFYGETGLLETEIDPIDPNTISVFFKGEFKGTLNTGDTPMYIYFQVKSPGTNCNIILKNARYQHLFGQCSLDANDILIQQTFTGGSTINLESLDYPLKSFCLSSPALLQDPGQGGYATTSLIYQKIIYGKDTILQDDQTLTLFYTIENEEGGLSGCDAGYSLNSKTLVCESNNPLGLPLNEFPENIESDLSADFDYVVNFIEDEFEIRQPDKGPLTTGSFSFSTEMPDEEEQVNINYLGTSNFMNLGDEIQITDSLKVKYVSGTSEARAKFDFTMDEDNCLKANYLDSGSDKSSLTYDLKIQIENNCGFDLDGGIQLRKSSQTFFTGEEILNQDYFIPEGLSNHIFIINIPTKETTETIITTIKPYIKFINGDQTEKLVSNIGINRAYFITPNGITTDLPYVVEEKETIIIKEISKNYTFIFIILGATIISFLIIYFVFIKKRRR